MSSEGPTFENQIFFWTCFSMRCSEELMNTSTSEVSGLYPWAKDLESSIDVRAKEKAIYDGKASVKIDDNQPKPTAR